MKLLKKLALAALLAFGAPAPAADYYTASGDPVTGSALSSAVLRAEYSAIAAGFAKIAPYTGNGGKILAINAGATAQEAITTTGTGSGVRATSPTLVTPVLGVATATSINKITLTQPATGATLTLTDGKTLAATNTLTLSGTDGTTMTFPTTSATIARTDAANTFTGIQSMTSPDITTSITTPSTTFTFLGANATTVNLATAASVALNIGHASAAAAFSGGISIPTGKAITGAGTAAITGFASASLGAITGTTGTLSGGLTLSGTPAGLGAGVRYISGAATAEKFYYNAATGGQHLFAIGEVLAGSITANGFNGVFGADAPAAATVTTLVVTGALTGSTFTFTPSAGENVVLTRDGGGPYIGTSSAHAFRIISNNSSAISISTSQVVTIPNLAGVGNRYVYIDANGVLTAGAAYP